MRLASLKLNKTILWVLTDTCHLVIVSIDRRTLPVTLLDLEPYVAMRKLLSGSILA